MELSPNTGRPCVLHPMDYDIFDYFSIVLRNQVKKGVFCFLTAASPGAKTGSKCKGSSRYGRTYVAFTCMLPELTLNSLF